MLKAAPKTALEIWPTFLCLGLGQQAFQFCFDLLNLWARASRVARDSRAVSGVMTREEPR
jgi:hypothetical protein